MYSLGVRSKARLKGVHPDLVKVVEKAIQLTTVDFTVLEGVRDAVRQKKLVESGASQTLNSRHLTGHAVDLGAWVDDQVDWSWPLYHKINAAMQEASKLVGVPIEWGGNWRTFKDGPHFQLPKKEYP
jgi:peptidoglycan L-alanyl-D-glutamate endopeptidase CwlK